MNHVIVEYSSLIKNTYTQTLQRKNKDNWTTKIISKNDLTRKPVENNIDSGICADEEGFGSTCVSIVAHLSIIFWDKKLGGRQQLLGC